MWTLYRTYIRFGRCDISANNNRSVLIIFYSKSTPSREKTRCGCKVIPGKNTNDENPDAKDAANTQKNVQAVEDPLPEGLFPWSELAT